MSTPADPKKRALGRGLDALLPAASSTAAAIGDRSLFSCPIERLAPQTGQPRQHFGKASLEELAASIKEHGLLEPIVVRRASGATDKYEIIAGERRWRASQLAGLREVLVVVKDVSQKQAFELAIIENVQREDLNAVEFAEALERLIKEHGYTQDLLAERLGKDRTTISNSLRLLNLPPAIRSQIVVGVLSEGHARALLGSPTPKSLIELAEKVMRGRLSVRATEALVREARDAGGSKKPDSKSPSQKSPGVKDLEARLSRALGAQVHVRDEGNRGEIAIPYADLDALDRLLEKLL